MSFRILCAIAIFALAGCASRQEAPTASSAVVLTDGASSGSESSSVEESNVSSAAMLAEEQMKAVEPSIYFDYDKFAIKDSYQNTALTLLHSLETNQKIDQELFKLPSQN